MANQDASRVGDLEVSQDLPFQRRSWTVQRFGWVAMAAVVVAALLGYLGEGPVSDARARSADGAYLVRYPKYTRHRSPEVLRMDIEEGGVAGNEARVAIERQYLEGVEVESVFPEPESVEVGGDEVVYVFELSDEGGPATVIFEVMYGGIGRKRGRVALDGHPGVSLSQFVYP